MSGRLLSKIEKAYIAGFIDGEGYIGIVKLKNGYSLQVSVGQNNPAPLEFINARYPGSFFLVTREGKTPMYSWRLGGAKAVGFLSDIEPFLINKRAQAQSAIKFQSMKARRAHRRHTNSTLEAEKRYYDNVRSFNAAHRKKFA